MKKLKVNKCSSLNMFNMLFVFTFSLHQLTLFLIFIAVGSPLCSCATTNNRRNSQNDCSHSKRLVQAPSTTSAIAYDADKSKKLKWTKTKWIFRKNILAFKFKKEKREKSQIFGKTKATKKIKLLDIFLVNFWKNKKKTSQQNCLKNSNKNSILAN